MPLKSSNKRLKSLPNRCKVPAIFFKEMTWNRNDALETAASPIAVKVTGPDLLTDAKARSAAALAHRSAELPAGLPLLAVPVLLAFW
ncbi:MAG: hypothetical protein JWO13_1480 [Acidobacteriales bacterium]|nr:hypothetical protein [Terriglobales bacterium]